MEGYHFYTKVLHEIGKYLDESAYKRIVKAAVSAPKNSKNNAQLDFLSGTIAHNCSITATLVTDTVTVTHVTDTNEIDTSYEQGERKSEALAGTS